MITAKQGHERDGEGLEPLVERLQGAFPADRIAKQDGEKVDYVVVPEAPPRKTHALGSAWSEPRVCADTQ